jgi:hypothetical protein
MSKKHFNSMIDSFYSHYSSLPILGLLWRKKLGVDAKNEEGKSNGPKKCMSKMRQWYALV